MKYRSHMIEFAPCENLNDKRVATEEKLVEHSVDYGELSHVKFKVKLNKNK